MSPFEPRQFNITEGKIAFTIKPGQVNWTDRQNKTLIKLGKDANFISLSKNEENQLAFSHFSVDTGLSVLKIDTSEFITTKEYSFILSWSIKERKMEVVVNGESKGSRALGVRMADKNKKDER